MDKYRKNTLLEIIEYFDNGDVLAQNEGDSSDQWVIPAEVFKSTYDKVEN